MHCSSSSSGKSDTGPRRQNCECHVGKLRLAHSDKSKVLGVVLDREFSFSGHVTHCLLRVIDWTLGYKFRNLLPESVQLQFLLMSVSQCCYPVYGTVYEGRRCRVQKIHSNNTFSLWKCYPLFAFYLPSIC